MNTNNQETSLQNNTQSDTENQTDVWPLVKGLTYFEPPQFPLNALPELLKSYVAALATATQTPVDLAALMVLATVSASNAKFYVVDYSSDWKEPLNLYIIAALPPASRKSSVFAACTQPLQEWEQEQLALMKSVVNEAESRKRILTNRQEKLEALIGNINTTMAKRADAESELATCIQELQNLIVPSLPRLIADDVTPEMLTSLLCEQNGKMAVMSAEGSLFTVIINGLYSSGGPNFEILLKAHSGDTIRVDRRGRAPEYVESPALTIGLAIQPDILSGLSKKPGLRGRGLLARFLYSFPPSNIGYRAIGTNTVPEGIKRQYNDLIRQLLSAGVIYEESGYNPTHITLSTEAKTAFDEYRGAIETRMQPFGTLSSITDWAGKLPGAVLRIAANLQLVINATTLISNIEITADTIRRAMVIGDYFIEQALGVFNIMSTDQVLEDAKMLWSWIESRRFRSFTKRELHQLVRGQQRFTRADTLSSPLALLEDRGYIRHLPINSALPGRPSNNYETNPLIFAEPSEEGTEENVP